MAVTVDGSFTSTILGELQLFTADSLMDIIEELFDRDFSPSSQMVQKICEELLHSIDAVFLDLFEEDDDAYDYVNDNFHFLIQDEKLHLLFSARDRENIAQAIGSLATIVESSINGEFDYIHDNCPMFIRLLERLSNPSQFTLRDDGRFEVQIPLDLEHLAV